MASTTQYRMEPGSTLEKAGVTATDTLLIVAVRPCRMTIKGFTAGDATVAPRPFIAVGNASADGYRYSTGSVAEINLTAGDQVLLKPTAADANGLTFTVSCERFPSYRNGEV